MIHETLAYEVFRAAGVAAPRTGYAYVRINGEDYGLYANVETYDKVMLNPVWFAATQHLYEGGYDLDVDATSIDLFEIDEGADDRTDLTALVAAADATGVPFSERLATVADLDEIVRMMAVDRYLGDWDGYMAPAPRAPNNYYLHSDGSGRFTLHPWGADQTFYDRSPPELPGGRLHVLCLADPVCATRYDQFMASLPALVDSLGLDAQAAALQAELADWQATDPRSEHTPAEIAAGVAAVRHFLAARPGDLADPVPDDDPPADPPPAGAPDTSIVHGPDDPRHAKRRHVRVRFTFESSQPGSSFECRVDSKPWSGCESPARVRVDRGRHRFRVRAIGADGSVDASPASWRWKVQRS